MRQWRKYNKSALMSNRMQQCLRSWRKHCCYQFDAEFDAAFAINVVAPLAGSCLVSANDDTVVTMCLDCRLVDE